MAIPRQRSSSISSASSSASNGSTTAATATPSTIPQHSSSEDEVMLLVRPPSSPTYLLSVSSSTTVASLGRQLSVRYNLPRTTRFLLAGRLRAPSATMAQLRITSNSPVDVILPLKAETSSTTQLSSAELSPTSDVSSNAVQTLSKVGPNESSMDWLLPSAIVPIQAATSMACLENFEDNKPLTHYELDSSSILKEKAPLPPMSPNINSAPVETQIDQDATINTIDTINVTQSSQSPDIAKMALPTVSGCCSDSAASTQYLTSNASSSDPLQHIIPADHPPHVTVSMQVGLTPSHENGPDSRLLALEPTLETTLKPTLEPTLEPILEPVLKSVPESGLVPVPVPDSYSSDPALEATQSCDNLKPMIPEALNQQLFQEAEPVQTEIAPDSKHTSTGASGIAVAAPALDPAPESTSAPVLGATSESALSTPVPLPAYSPSSSPTPVNMSPSSLKNKSSGTSTTSNVAAPTAPSNMTGSRKTVRGPPMCQYKRGSHGNGRGDCRSPAQRIVGDCGFCGGRFCSRHRHLESHACVHLEDCKRDSYQRNAQKLVSERTVVIKGV